MGNNRLELELINNNFNKPYSIGYCVLKGDNYIHELKKFIQKYKFRFTVDTSTFAGYWQFQRNFEI